MAILSGEGAPLALLECRGREREVKGVRIKGR